MCRSLLSSATISANLLVGIVCSSLLGGETCPPRQEPTSLTGERTFAASVGALYTCASKATHRRGLRLEYSGCGYASVPLSREKLEEARTSLPGRDDLLDETFFVPGQGAAQLGAVTPRFGHHGTGAALRIGESGVIDLDGRMLAYRSDRAPDSVALGSASVKFSAKTEDGEEVLAIEFTRYSAGGELRLMPELKNPGSLPTEGKNLVVVAEVQDELHFRLFDRDGVMVVDTSENSLREQARRIGRVGYDLCLMSPLKGLDGVPTRGRNLAIIAEVKKVPHVRIFDGDGERIVDDDLSVLIARCRRSIEDAKQNEEIEGINRQLAGLWPPHQLTARERVRIAARLAAIVEDGQASAVEGLRARLSQSWPPRMLSRRERELLMMLTTSLLCYDRFKFSPDDTVLVTITSEQEDGAAVCRGFLNELESGLREMRGKRDQNPREQKRGRG